MAGAVLLRTSRTRTIAVTERLPSFVASIMVCECGSMMPGVTNLPVPSMVFAPAGASEVLADLRDLAVAEEDVGVLQRPLRHRHHGGVLDQHRPATGAFGATYSAGAGAGALAAALLVFAGVFAGCCADSVVPVITNAAITTVVFIVVLMASVGV